MIPAILIAIGAAAFFAIYALIVIRYRAKQEHKREREKGLDPLR